MRDTFLVSEKQIGGCINMGSVPIFPIFPTFILILFIPLAVNAETIFYNDEAKKLSEQCPEYTIEPPTLLNVDISNLVIFSPETGIYTYDYRIKSSKKNTGCIWWFDVDISYPEGGIKLPLEGLIDYPKRVDKEALGDPEAVPMVPVAFPTLPKIIKVTGAWTAGLTWEGEAVWGPLHNIFRLAPGGDLHGLSMTSYGLPSIRNFHLKPVFNPPPFEEGEDTPEKVEELLRTRESLAWKGKTIGPTAPPADFKPVDFLSNIINMKHEAYKLGWIKNEGILKSLDAKLENAKKDIEKGKTRSAKNTLKAFINEVEAQGCESYENCASGKHLTSEAYGLLKYNAQYLIDHL